MIGIMQPNINTCIELPVPQGYIQSQVHPSIQYIPQGWNGYTHWMFSTPWGSNDEENPCLYYANKDQDGNHPMIYNAYSGNPIVPKLPGNDYNADCELVFDQNANNGSGRMYMYWKDTSIIEPISGTKTGGWKVLQSDNGFTWYNERIVKYDTVVSLSHVKIGDKYYFYFGSSGANAVWGDRSIFRNLELYILDDLENQDFTGEFTRCSIQLKNKMQPWHFCTFRHDNKTYMISNAYEHNISSQTKSYLYVSINNIDFKQVSTIPMCNYLNPYRPTAFIDEDNNLVYMQAVMGLPTTTNLTKDGKGVCQHVENITDLLRIIKGA